MFAAHSPQAHLSGLSRLKRQGAGYIPSTGARMDGGKGVTLAYPPHLDTMDTTDWGWHRYATEYVSPFGHNFPPAPSVSWWMPTVTTYAWRGDKAVQMYAPTTLTRWEADEYISKAQRKGYTVEVWDQTPTCLTQQRYACGPCTPLTCSVGRPLRGAAPRYH